jgi:hypothetical protein
MVFQLINKNTNEVIDSVDLSNVGKEGAKTFFRERKKLPQDEFDKILEKCSVKPYLIFVTKVKYL